MLSMSMMMMDVTAVAAAAASFCDFACVCMYGGWGPSGSDPLPQEGEIWEIDASCRSCLFALRAEAGVSSMASIEEVGEKGACACSCRFFPSPLFLLGCLACTLFFLFSFLIYNDDLSVWFGVLDG